MNKTFYIITKDGDKSIIETSLKTFKATHGLSDSQGGHKYGTLPTGGYWARDPSLLPEITFKPMAITATLEDHAKYPRSVAGRHAIEAYIVSVMCKELNEWAEKLPDDHWSDEGWYDEGQGINGLRELNEAYIECATTTLWDVVAEWLDENYRESTPGPQWKALINWSFKQMHRPFSWSHNDTTTTNIITRVSDRNSRQSVIDSQDNTWLETLTVWETENFLRYINNPFWVRNAETAKFIRNPLLETDCEDIKEARANYLTLFRVSEFDLILNKSAFEKIDSLSGKRGGEAYKTKVLDAMTSQFDFQDKLDSYVLLVA